MQSLNWLLRSVTQPVCLHDLLWWFVTSLTPIDVELESEEDNKPPRKIEDQVCVTNLDFLVRSIGQGRYLRGVQFESLCRPILFFLNVRSPALYDKKCPKRAPFTCIVFNPLI